MLSFHTHPVWIMCACNTNKLNSYAFKLFKVLGNRLVSVCSGPLLSFIISSNIISIIISIIGCWFHDQFILVLY